MTVEGKPNLFIVRGVPGSGKTTFVKKSNVQCLHLEADMLCYVQGAYNWRPDQVRLNHEACWQIAKITMDRGADIVISNTFTRRWEFCKYVDYAESLGYNVEVYRMMGDFENTHDVPPEIVQSMRDRFEDFEGEIRVQL